MSVEETTEFQPKFDKDGLITCVTLEHGTNLPLMVAYMNRESLERTLEIREMVYYSRSRQELWHKGATSGQFQKLIRLSVDCDQDCLWAEVQPQGDGGACHTGRKSCFYREVVDINTLSKPPR